MISYAISLTDAVTAPAKAVSNSLMNTEKGARVLQRAMTTLQGQMLKADALGDVTKVAKLQERFELLGRALEETEKHVTPLQKTMAVLRDQIAGRWRVELDPVEMFSKIGEGAELALEGVKKITEGIIEFGKMAIEAVESKEKLTAAFSALAGGEDAGKGTLNMIRSLEREVPQNEKQLSDWARTLLGAGVSADALQGSLKAVAGSEALVGGGEQVMGLLAKLNEAGQKGSKLKFSTSMLAGTGVTEAELMKQLGMTPHQLDLAKKQGTLTGKELSDAMVSILQTKGAGPLEQQTLGLASQWEKLKDNFMRLFEDVDVKPLFEAVKSLFGVFDQGTASGQALKTGMTAVLGSIFKSIAVLIPKVRTFFLEMIIFGLKAYINVWKPISHHMELVKAIAVGLLAGMAALAVGGVIALVPLIASAWALAAGVLAATWPLLAIAAGLTVVTGLVVYFQKEIGNALVVMAEWAKAGWTIASDFIDGLVGGIAKGAQWVLDAITHLGSSMLSGIKGVLGIASPSAEMMKLGVFTGQGFAQGVTAANDNVMAAGAGMSAAVGQGMGAGGSGGGGGGGAAPR